MNLEEFSDIVTQYFHSHNWTKKQCNHCHRTFFTKSDFENCQSYECNNREYTFLNYSRRSKLVTEEELITVTKEFFSQKGLVIKKYDSVVNKIGDTIFIVAGIQCLDNIVHREEPFDNTVFFSPQPCIRLKFLGEGGVHEGISSSFVNLCSAEVGASADKYWNHLTLWLDFFSKVGIYVKDLAIVIDKTDIRAGVMKGRMIEINYGGLELGEGIFFYEVMQKTRDPISIIDFGFGFERILWSINKTRSYFLLLGPKLDVVQGNQVLIDLIKTLTLMAMSGVYPSNKNHGFHFRRIVKMIVRNYLGIQIEHLIRYSYSYWKKFITPCVDLHNCISSIMLETQYQTNRQLCHRLNITQTFEREIYMKPTEEFLKHVLKYNPKKVDSLLSG